MARMAYDLDPWAGYALPTAPPAPDAALLKDLGVTEGEANIFAEYYSKDCARTRRTPDPSALKDWREETAAVPTEASARAYLASHIEQLILATMGDERAHFAISERFIFTSVYGRQPSASGRPAKPLPFGEALRRALDEHAAIQEGKTKQKTYTCRPGTFDKRHLAIRLKAFPYVPACAASDGDMTVDAVDAKDGSLCGYIAFSREGYVDDLSVLPAWQGRGVARALVGAASAQLAAADPAAELSLHVRACNRPALRLYKSLGLTQGEWEFPPWYDYHGGFHLEGRAAEIAERAAAGSAAPAAAGASASSTSTSFYVAPGASTVPSTNATSWLEDDLSFELNDLKRVDLGHLI